VPFMVRWPGKVSAGRVSNEIVHGVDMFATLAKIAGAKVPDDRPIDSIDQSAFLLGNPRSRPRGLPDLGRRPPAGGEVAQLEAALLQAGHDVRAAVETGHSLHHQPLHRPREEKPTPDSWVVTPMLKIVGAFQASTKNHPLIPMGTPDPYTPPK